MAHPIPDEALDDRLATVGTSGSGKTYTMMAAVERLLARKARVIIPDPLGVWWGLRLLADGKTASPFKVVIFGGPHGDLPLTEHAGALIGEAAASMAESCIIDLSELGTKAAERRFMLAFLTALYRKTSGEPVHLVLDEADMWAPQKPRDQEGEASKLLGMMETIVRRGRIKGFIPWMITQRPAVLNKDVLSQVDGVIAMKLVATQDRNALDGWIEGSADVAEAKKIKGDMPSLQKGQGIVWLPARGVLRTVDFPAKRTFDSSRTPARGEVKRTLELKPLDVDSLKEKLAKVEAEVAATDPKKLAAKVAELERKLKTAPQAAASPEALAKARSEGHKEGYAEGHAAGHREGYQKGSSAGYADGMGRAIEALTVLKKEKPDGDTPAAPVRVAAPPLTKSAPPPRVRPQTSIAPAGELTAPQNRIIESLAFWAELGFDRPTREQVGAVAGYSPSSGNFANLLGQLKATGYVDYPGGGQVSLTEGGQALAPAPQGGRVRDRLAPVLTAPQGKLLDALEGGEEMTREELGEATGYSATSGNFANLLGQLRTLGFITYPGKGTVAAEPWIWHELEAA